MTFTCTCNVHQKSKALLISSQSDGVKSLWISYHSVVSDGIWNAEKPCISKHFLALDVTSRCRIGATPKRKAAGSNPVRDASALSRKIFHEIFRVSSKKKKLHWWNAKKTGLLSNEEKHPETAIPLKKAHGSVFTGVSGCKSVINHPYRCRNLKYDTLNCYDGRKDLRADF